MPVLQLGVEEGKLTGTTGNERVDDGEIAIAGADLLFTTKLRDLINPRRVAAALVFIAIETDDSIYLFIDQYDVGCHDVKNGVTVEASIVTAKLAP